MAANQENVYGPYDVEAFLCDPTEPGRRLPVLALQNFSMSHRDEQIGLDFIESRNRNRAGDIPNDDLTWTGDVWFSGLAGNKKQLKPEAIMILHEAASDRRQRIDWTRGIYVRLTGKYWRHAFTSDTRTPGTLTLLLSIDTLPSIRDRLDRRHEGDRSRRFLVETKRERFEELSQISTSQAFIVQVLEFIKSRKGQFTSTTNRTVEWYDAWYKQLLQSPNGGQEVNNESLQQMLARHINSPSFLEIIMKHKMLISRENVAAFTVSLHRRGVPEEALPVEAEVEPEPMEEPAPGELAKLEELDEDFLNATIVEDTKVLYDDSSTPFPASVASTRATPSTTDQSTSQIAPKIESSESKGDITTDSSTRATPSTIDQSINQTTTKIESSDNKNDITTGSSETSNSRASTASTSDPAILRLIPPVMFERQVLPDNCRWSCPVRGCSMTLDFNTELPRWALDCLLSKEKKFLEKGAWTSKCSRVQFCFSKMINRHYANHLEDLGLKVDGLEVTILNQRG